MTCAIVNGTVVDGGGGEPYRGDVLIKDGRIAAVKPKPAFTVPEGAEVIDASGKVVTPGFTDIHRHCDLAARQEGFGGMELAQGITSVVTGNCGLTPVPYNPRYRDLYDALLTPIMGAPGPFFSGGADVKAAPSRPGLPLPHVQSLVGSCSVRIAVKGMDPSPFTGRETDAAVGHIRDAMDAGALGLSFGLMYYPEYYSARDELITFARAAASRGGILACHIRGEGDSVVDSVREVIEIAERADAPLQISHFKACGVRNWGVKIHEAIEVIEERRRRGADICVDVYPYDGGATTLMSLIPPGFMKETVSESVRFMQSPGGAAALEETLSRPTPGWDNYIESLGFDRIIISGAGKSIGRIMAERPGLNPYQYLCDLMAENNCEVGVTVMSMSRADVDTVARLPYAVFISDALYPQSGPTHPRAYGAFPKILRDMVRERKVLSLREAVKKMTSLPAERLRLSKRGLLREGYVADVCVFDPEEIRDNATWREPSLWASGMDTVLVRGERYEH